MKEIEDGTAQSIVEADVSFKISQLKDPASDHFDKVKYENFIRQLILSEGTPITVSSKYADLYYSLVEKFLMDVRQQYLNRNRTAQLQEQRKVKVRVRTVSGNVKLFPKNAMHRTDGRKSLDYDGMLEHARKENGVYPLRRFGSKYHFGNPFSGTGKKGVGIVKEFGTIKEASVAYLEWLVTDKYDEQFPELKERKNWINRTIASGKLKGKSIFYFAERGEFTHANILDHLINNNQPLIKEDVDKLNPC
jgi:hypothetical protein